jgi:hypothetical protein
MQGMVDKVRVPRYLDASVEHNQTTDRQAANRIRPLADRLWGDTYAYAMLPERVA